MGTGVPIFPPTMGTGVPDLWGPHISVTPVHNIRKSSHRDATNRIAVSYIYCEPWNASYRVASHTIAQLDQNPIPALMLRSS